ncbi:MAG TPA: cytochrome c-type biogenesis protein CcmH [Acidimicrobiales bacterium]|nr:cytochrome c-type biogenesis protein CcmH [Acidimicrobiales bacterium]
MRTGSRRLSWGLLALVLVGALAIGSRGESGPPTEDQRVQRIASVVRCPTCRGLSAAQSDAPSAEAIRDEVRRRVQEGETDAQIKAYLVSRYGEDILLQPKSRVVWALPVIGGAAAVGGLVFALRRRRVKHGPAVSDADEALVARAMRAKS